MTKYHKKELERDTFLQQYVPTDCRESARKELNKILGLED